ncbi:hypothetical protein AX17_007540 [Amanita inopinata Kibby_2008]|nr:hypothetical protein AX17_007540 [Amanita inopinata Kibby_2008]
MLGLNWTQRASSIARIRGAQRWKHSVAELQAKFRDPSSPYHIPPGSTGPAAPDEIPHSPLSVTHSNVPHGLEEAHQKLLNEGLDPHSFWEQRIVWGDQDAFQHVNNARYVRFFESSRIEWMKSLGEELGGSAKAEDLIRGRGISLILKSIEVQFRRPVTYPDTLLIGYRPTIPPPKADARVDLATFHVTARAYSVSQQAFVAHSNEALVWYDYAKLKKCDPGDRVREIVKGRMRTF